MAQNKDDIQFSGLDEKGFILHSKKMELEAGWFGRCFGSGKNAATNISGVALLLLILTFIGVICISFKTGETNIAFDYLKIISPIITLILGFLFGKNFEQ